MFFELRPGLIAWLLVEVSSYVQNASGFDWRLSILLLFHASYVADALWFESTLLTTYDVLHESFGFKLIFGDLVFVPFVFSAPFCHASVVDVSIGTMEIVTAVLLHCKCACWVLDVF